MQLMMRSQVKSMHWIVTVCLFFTTSAFARDTPVVVDTARIDTVVQSTTAAARVVATETLLVPAETEETVRQVKAKLGDRVREGQVLAVLESRNVQLEVDSLRAREAYLEQSLALLTEQARLRSNQLERAERLNTRNLLTQDAREQAALNLMNTRAERLRTAFELEDVQLDLADATRRLQLTQLVAPAAGRLVSATAQAGQYVRTGDTLFEILPDTALELDAEIRADAYDALSVGQVMTARLRDRVFDIRVRALLAEQNQRTGARNVRLQFIKAPEMALVVGETADIELPVGGERSWVTVAKDAVMPIAGGHRVVVVDSGQAQPRQVRLGPGIPGRIAILEGIEAGEQVVIQGQEGLRSGQSVVVMEPNA